MARIFGIREQSCARYAPHLNCRIINFFAIRAWPAKFSQVFGTQDAGASWKEYSLPRGVHDAYAVACI